MFKTKPRGMSPLCCVAVTGLSVVGAFSLFMMAKKKMGCAMKQIKKMGCECAQAVEDGFDAIRCECASDNSQSGQYNQSSQSNPYGQNSQSGQSNQNNQFGQNGQHGQNNQSNRNNRFDRNEQNGQSNQNG